MGTFYSKDGPITTEKDYDVVKRVPEGQVVYNPKFPTLVYYENQVLPMKNGVIVNHEGSDWIMEPYENYARKYNLNRQNNQNTQTPNTSQREIQINPEKIKELIDKLREQKNLEPLLSSHRELPDPDLKEIEEKYGIYISSTGEFLLKENINLDQFKNLATLILKYAFYLNTQDPEVFEHTVSLKQMSIFLQDDELLKIFFGGSIQGSSIKDTDLFSKHLLSLMYDPNITFSELDIKFADILFDKAKKYYQENNSAYFNITINQNNLPWNFEDKNKVLSLSIFYLDGAIKDGSELANSVILSMPYVILGEFSMSLAGEKKEELLKIIKNKTFKKFFNSLSEAVDDYINNGFDENVLLLSLYDKLTRSLYYYIEADIFDYTEDEKPGFSILWSIGSFYIGYVLQNLFSNKFFLDILQETDKDRLYDRLYGAIEDFISTFDLETNFIKMFIYRPKEIDAAAAFFISKIYENNLHNLESVQEYLKQKELSEKQKEESIDNFDNYLEDIQTVFDLVLSNKFDLMDSLKGPLQQLFQKKYPHLNLDSALSFIPFILQNIDNPILAVGVNKELLKDVLDIILKEIEDRFGENNIFKKELRKQIEYLLNTKSQNSNNFAIENFSGRILELILSVNQSNVHENTQKINSILRAAFLRLTEMKDKLVKEKDEENIKYFIQYAEFLSETIKMFEDLFHPQNTADLIFIEMKQNLDLLNLKKDLYQMFVDLEEYDYSLAQALKESLLQRRDNLIFLKGHKIVLKNARDADYANEELKSFKLRNIFALSANLIRSSIEDLKDVDFVKFEGKEGELLNNYKDELLSHLNYIVNYLISGYKTDSVFKLNFSIYKSLEILNLLHQFSSNERVREYIKSIGSNVLSAKYLITDVLMENKYNTNTVAPISSGSTSSLLSGHIYVMNVIKDLDKYKEFAKRMLENFHNKSFDLLTTAKLKQTRQSLLTIRLDRSNNLVIDVPIRVDFAHMGTKSDGFTPSDEVIEDFSGNTVSINGYNLSKLGVKYGKLEFPKLTDTKTNSFLFDDIKDIIFSKEQKSLESLTNTEYAISNVALIISHEKFTGAFKPTSDALVISSGTSTDKSTVKRFLDHLKKQMSYFASSQFEKIKRSSDVKKLKQQKEELDNYFQQYSLKNVSKEAFDNLLDTEEILKNTFKHVVSAELKYEDIKTKENVPIIELTVSDEKGQTRKFTIYLSSINLESFKRISYSFMHSLLNSYIEEKIKNLNRPKTGFYDSATKILEREINEFQYFIERLNENDYIQSTGIILGIVKALQNSPNIKEKFLKFLANQVLLEASLGINAAYIVDDEGIGLAPFNLQNDYISSLATHYGYPIYMNKSSSPRFMYKTFKTLSKYSERTLKDKELVKAARNISRKGAIRYLSGFFRAYGSHYIVMDIYDELFRSKAFQYAMSKRNISLFDFIDKILESGIINKFDEFFHNVMEGHYYFGFGGFDRYLSEEQLKTAEEIARQLSSIVGVHLDVSDAIGFLTMLNRSFKATMFHELGHFLDYESNDIIRKDIYRKIKQKITKALDVLSKKVDSNTELSDNAKHAIRSLINDYIQNYLINDGRKVDYTYHDRYIYLLQRLSNKDKEILLQIILETRREGYFLHNYALFNTVEVPSTTLEYLSTLGKDEFIKMFPEYKEIVDYLYSVMRRESYL